ncbi:DUF1641 domain-containing protein [Evansella sp. LMS18]|jgi:uncharacterized protein YjgD (DUF1641 family)|uniref:DUF1641 domain-containing protein n=1 Tax=Evansella sp. LMS18 TaxID=2924033 RepID=UPI0020D14EFD|nr:DUF1641 domain-containing protein [Evansella sp. LMS18]UTR12586.1 DUF1641 domain-containing protein [Evansella sp. LMS18]
MAKPIRKIEPMRVTEEEERAEALEEVQEALVENKEAVLATIDLMKNLHGSGVTRLLNGLLAEGDKVLEIIVKEANKDENTNTIRNLLLLFGTLGTINMKDMEPLLRKINAGVEQAAVEPDPEEKTGYFDLVRKLKDPEVNRSLTLLLRFLEGMGQETNTANEGARKEKV